MTRWRSLLLGCVALPASVCRAGEEAPAGDAAATAPGWAFALTAYPTDVRGGDHYVSAIGTADRGPLHLEARYSYESVGARSAYVGWSFTGGEALTWQLTPIAGGAWGTTRSLVAGFEGSAAWRAVDAYVEAEYVPGSAKHDGYTYAWSELGVRPVAWLRLGVVAQRTRSYGGERDLQRGPLAQLTFGAFTLGAYWFNPGAHDQVAMASLGAKF